MKATQLNLGLIFLLSMASCQVSEQKNNESKTADLKSDILGSWYNLSMEVQINSAGNNQDSSSTFKVPAGQWEEILQIKPIITTYRKDGTYTSVYRNLADSLIDESSDTWEVKEDSLFIFYQDQPYSYLTLVNGDTAEYKGMVDWDQDGMIDDLYTGIQIRLAE